VLLPGALAVSTMHVLLYPPLSGLLVITQATGETSWTLPGSLELPPGWTIVSDDAAGTTVRVVILLPWYQFCTVLNCTLDSSVGARALRQILRALISLCKHTVAVLLQRKYAHFVVEAT
jgi:hypothetical protein